jgi:predicted nucleic acid-binding Zn ribbon protein
MKHSAKPLPIDRLLDRTLKELEIDGQAKRYDIFNRWEEIVGPAIAAVTVPERIASGTIIVAVKNAAWRYELTMRKSEILHKIRQETGGYEVKDIQWR